MSGGLPEEKPWASGCPRSEATITLTLLPVCLLQAAAALFTANVSAGPELPIRAVMVTALLRVGEPRAAPTATASAQTVTTTSATRQRAIRIFRCAFTKRSPSLENEKDERAVGAAARAVPVGGFVWLSPPFRSRNGCWIEISFGPAASETRPSWKRLHSVGGERKGAMPFMSRDFPLDWDGSGERLLGRNGIASNNLRDDRGCRQPSGCRRRHRLARPEPPPQCPRRDAGEAARGDRCPQLPAEPARAEPVAAPNACDRCRRPLLHEPVRGRAAAGRRHGACPLSLRPHALRHRVGGPARACLSDLRPWRQIRRPPDDLPDPTRRRDRAAAHGEVAVCADRRAAPGGPVHRDRRCAGRRAGDVAPDRARPQPHRLPRRQVARPVPFRVEP